MNRAWPFLFLAFGVAGTSAAGVADHGKQMSFAELVTGLASRIPGTSGDVEGFLGAPSGAQMGRMGWRHEPIDYRTRDGTLLHITLSSDWPNKKAPDVVRVVAEVDAKLCLDPSGLRDKLTQTQQVDWKALSPLAGWTGMLNGRFLNVTVREGRCLNSASVADRVMQRPMSTVHRGVFSPGPYVPLPAGH